MKSKIDLDKSIILISLLYIILPIIIFCYGWLKIYIAIPASIVFFYVAYKAFINITKESVKIIKCDNIKFWIISGVVIGFWVYLSGIGGGTYQNGDFWVRNPMYRDLCDYSWPVVFDLKNQSLFVQQILGTSDKVVFSYYFSWWLLPAFLSKCFLLGEIGRNNLLFIYSVIGVFCVFYNMVRYEKKISYIILSVFIFFSGLDFLGLFLKNAKIPVITTEHIEWWSSYFQLSSNTTLLFWVFNQAIPTWLITILFMQMDTKNSIGLSALSFAYSPWATLGAVPLAIGKNIGQNQEKKCFRNLFSIQNILASITMLIIYGLFYTCGKGGESSSETTGFIFSLHFPASKVLINLIVFLFCEIIIFYIVMGKSIQYKKFYIISLLEFIIFPLFKVIQYSWLIRGLIPASFILMMYCIDFLLNDEKTKQHEIRKRILVVVLIIGSFTPLSELLRSTSKTMQYGTDRNEIVYSFGNIKFENERTIKAIQDQYIKYDYMNSLFFRYLAKNSNSDKQLE